MTVQSAFVAGHYAGRFLPPVLQGVQGQSRQGRGIVHTVYADNAALVAGMIRHCLSLQISQ